MCEGSWGPLDRRQPSREAETITQLQIQYRERWRDGRDEADRGGVGGKVVKGGGQRQGEDWIRVQVRTDRAGQKGRNDSVDKEEQREERKR